MKNNEAIRIFMSYASEDYESVKIYYNKLKQLGYKPWLDKEDLLPGENWHFEIMKELKKTDFFMLFLTNNSSTKRGYIQREIKTALDIWEEKLPDDIFLIPIKLEDCSLPDHLSELHYIEIFDTSEIHKKGSNFDKLIESLAKGSEKLGKQPLIQNHDYQVVMRSIQEIQTDSVPFDIEATYPQLESLGEQSYDKTNKYLFSIVHSKVADIRNYNDEDINHFTGEMFIGYQIHLAEDYILSVSFGYFDMITPSTYPNHYRFTCNLLPNSSNLIKLDDIFNKDSNYFEYLKHYCIDSLSEESAKEHDDDTTSNNSSYNSAVDFYLNDKDNYSEFYLTETKITFTFSPSPNSSIPHAWGYSEVSIPYSDLTEYISEDSVISTIIKNK